MIEALKSLHEVEIRRVSDDTFLMHLGGKLEVTPRLPLKTRADLSMAYTPGVARVCKAVEEDPRTSFNLTIRKNCIAIVSDGSAVLGLGNIGPEAAMPVMEGKAILFKQFGQVDAFPLCINTQNPDEIIDFCIKVAPTFGGINLEDIKAPKCFYIEERLIEELDIPVFHDDQHGTAVVVLAGLINSLKLTGKKPADMRMVVSGAGAAGIACTKILKEFGIGYIVVCDTRGAIHEGRTDLGDNAAKKWVVENTNEDGDSGSVQDVLMGADIFVGVSAPGLLTRRDIQRMRKDPIIFAMANPTPEVMPEEIHDVAGIVATGRSDYPNQVNNVLAFPGIFRGALDCRAETINHEMKLAAAKAIAGVIKESDLVPDYVIPSVFSRRVLREVRRAVSKAAHETKVAHRMPKGIRLRI
jgi:malate dehydrogenase (oxaloacetate-decarboxylating)